VIVARVIVVGLPARRAKLLPTATSQSAAARQTGDASRGGASRIRNSRSPEGIKFLEFVANYSPAGYPVNG
jgi:hypothetical protein